MIYLAFLLPFVAYYPTFTQPFYIPKLISYYFLSVVCAFALPKKGSLSKGENYFFGFFIGLLCLTGSYHKEWYSAFWTVSYFLAAIPIYLFLKNSSDEKKQIIAKNLVILSVAEACLVFVQKFWWKTEPYGTLGNTEFLATLLGVSFFLSKSCVDTFRRRKVSTQLFDIAGVIFIPAILISGSKGTLLFIAVYLLLRWLPKKLIFPMAGVALVAGALFAPSSYWGRIWIWIVSGHLITQNPILGVGPMRFGHHLFLDTEILFQHYPKLQSFFGPYTSEASDPHQLILLWGATMGVGGVILAVVFLFHLVKISWQRKTVVGIALLLLVYKCLYTVVVPSIVGLLLMIILVAWLAKSEEIVPLPRKFIATVTLLVATANTYLCSYDFHLYQGMRNLFLIEPDAALVSLERARAILPENPDVNLAAAHAYFLKKDFSRMSRFLEATLSKQATMDTYKRSSHLYFYSRLIDKSFPLLTRINTVFPEHRTTQIKLALIHLEREEYFDAERLASEVLYGSPRRRSYTDESNQENARRILNTVRRQYEN